MAPTHRAVERSPRGDLVECGGIWKIQNRGTGAGYFTLSIRDHGFNANLSKAANQDGHLLGSQRRGVKQARSAGIAPVSRRKLQS